jgi:hypothetical protein
MYLIFKALVSFKNLREEQFLKDKKKIQNCKMNQKIDPRQTLHLNSGYYCFLFCQNFELMTPIAFIFKVKAR